MGPPLDAATLYRLLHRGNPGDVALYRRRCLGAGRVLELGCGAGRVLLALAAAGRQVVGLDLDGGLLACAARGRQALPSAARRGVALVRGDMRALPLAGPFERVILPYSTLYCLPDEAAVAATLAGARAVIAPGGSLTLDAWWLPQGARFRGRFVQVDLLEHEGMRVEVFEHDVLEGPSRALRARITYRLRACRAGGRPVVWVEQVVHHLRPWERLAALLASTGWAVEQVRGGFESQCFDPASSTHVVVEARPAGW